MEPTCILNMSVLPLTKTPTRSLNNITLQECGSKKTKTEDKKTQLVEKLLEKIPQVNEYFTVHRKVGEGTFSNVFVASSKLLIEKKKFAIKHLTPTSHPSRIMQELRCLKDIGGRDNVVGLEVCFRNQDAVAFVMPYFAHDSFSSYVTEMDPRETQLYMKNLLIALQRVHSFNIIHRDVKPSNFLYNRKEKRFLLVDFGLSHQVEYCVKKISGSSCSSTQNDRKRVIDPFERENPLIEKKRPVLHSLSNNVLEHSGERQPSKYSLKKKTPPFKENSPISKNVKLNRNINQVKRNLQFGNITAEAKKEAIPLLSANINKTLNNEATSGYVFNKVGSSFTCIQNSQIKSQFSLTGIVPKTTASFRKPLSKGHAFGKDCGCDGKPRICNTCITRKPMHAPRAGTPGYRSPEVLLKYPHQTTAVDIWSAGIIMVSILSGSYPFFRAPDDITALMEMITVFGTEAIQTTATKLGRNLLCNEIRKPINLRKMCERLRKRTDRCKGDSCNFPTCHLCFQKIIPNEGCLCKSTVASNLVNEDNDHSKVKEIQQEFPDQAYDLLSKLLCIDPDQRYTASDALEHSFFKIKY